MYYGATKPRARGRRRGLGNGEAFDWDQYFDHPENPYDAPVLRPPVAAAPVAPIQPSAAGFWNSANAWFKKELIAGSGITNGLALAGGSVLAFIAVLGSRRR